MGAMLLLLPVALAHGGQGGTTFVWHPQELGSLQELAELSQSSWGHADPPHSIPLEQLAAVVLLPPCPSCAATVPLCALPLGFW